MKTAAGIYFTLPSLFDILFHTLSVVVSRISSLTLHNALTAHPLTSHPITLHNALRPAASLTSPISV